MIRKRLLLIGAAAFAMLLGIAVYTMPDTWQEDRFDLQLAAVDGLPSALVFKPGTADHVHWTTPLDAPAWSQVKE